MKRIRYAALLILASLILTQCGGSGGPADIQGPELNIGEALQLVVNQIYVKNWSGTGIHPFFSVYIQDGLSEEYLVCSGPDQGLNIANAADTYYGNLEATMLPVTGATDKNTPIFNIVIVADKEDPCPSPINETDTIVGTVQINFGELLDSPIDFGNGAAYITFIGTGNPDIKVPEMSAVTTDALTVGELYFEDTPPGDVLPDYYMVLYVSNGTTLEFHSIIEPSNMPILRMPGTIYSWLNLIFPDTDGISVDEDMLKRKARVEFLKNDGQLIGKTSEEFLGDLIGRTVEFTNGLGYLKFRSVAN